MAQYLRDLTQADLIGEYNALPDQSRIQKIRAPHHAIAKLVAEGRKAVEIARITGFSQNRICLLQNDPAFQELVHHYTDVNQTCYINAHERLAQLAVTAAEELQERLIEKPQQVSTREVLDIMTAAMDRSVAPSQSIVNHRSLPADAEARRTLVAAQVRELFTPRTEGVIIDMEPSP